MTQLKLETLENSVGKAVAITCADGDTLRGTVAYVDDEYRDVRSFFE
jgi:small nuclear ribonucleoprotein (snRNP)-like protein